MQDQFETIEGGFADPVIHGQFVFKAVMDALARPGSIHEIDDLANPPTPLTQELAAVALTLVDHDTPVWLDAALSAAPAVLDWLSFHTGAPVVKDAGAAHFAFVSSVGELPALDAFAMGTDEYPDRSTTIVLALESIDDGEVLTLKGPGIEHEAELSPAGLPDDFETQWAENREKFPRGIDLVLVAPGVLAALPRTTVIIKRGV